MHNLCKSSVENRALLYQIVGQENGTVAVRYSHNKKKPIPSTFFMSVAEAEPTIRAVLADITVSGCWIAFHKTRYDHLYGILEDISKTRKFACMLDRSGEWNSFDVL